MTGVQAQHRLGTGAAVLSVFSVLQLAVYAAMQVPVGALLDRLGSRRMIFGGAVLMGVGHLVMATAHAVPAAVLAAVLARVLVGADDAITLVGYPFHCHSRTRRPTPGSQRCWSGT